MPLPKDLVAASATPLILSILSHGDSYGYAIIEEVRRLSDGQLQWSDGMLYPILHRLENKGQISAYWGESDSGRKRKYYKLKQAGKKELNTQQENWRRLSAMLETLQEGKPCLN
jgi:DNA-binding PadR family transcriptional regulator